MDVKPAAETSSVCPVPKKARWAALGVTVTFLFFLIKGLCWLIVPAVLAWWAAR